MTRVLERARRGERDWAGAATAAIGGAALVTGALLPWMSLFAGLRRYPGVAGLYGRVLLAGGMLAIAGGLALLVRPAQRLRVTIGMLGVALAGLASWVVLGLRSTTGALSHHPLLLARPGAGPFVALAGGLVVMALILPPRRHVARAPKVGLTADGGDDGNVIQDH
ncbi:MAG TPA: hypothetical protein VLN49_22675 [Gemmatimonadaceae bacterium]|nr:hypothetical protein [Gemmatimonadaceae bacterium]